MKPLAAVLVAIALWFVPLSISPAGAAGLQSDEGSYRMRLCELALFSGESARHDRMLEFREGQDVPYGAFAPSASAFLLARLLPSSAIDPQRGELDEEALIGAAQRLMLVLGWIAALALLFAGSKFLPRSEAAVRESPWRLVGPLIVALAWTALALAPTLDGGSVRAGVWELILCSVVLGGAALLATPRDLADQVGLAIGLGLLAGLALANNLPAWPTALAPLLALALGLRDAPAGVRRNALRTAIFFVATASIVSVLRTPFPSGSVPWPSFEPAWPAHAFSTAELAIDLLCIALIGWLSLAGPASPRRRLLSLVLVLSFVLRSIDARFATAPLAPAGCALLWCANSMWLDEGRRAVRHLISVAVVATMLLAAVFHDGASYSAESVQGLREIRIATPSSGAWNHPGARQEYAILANPRAAGAIVFHARRPVCGALLPGAPVTSAAREAAAALLSESAEALAARAQALHTPFVIAARRDLVEIAELVALSERGGPRVDRVGAAGSLLRQLLVGTELSGFELVRRVPGQDSSAGVADLAIWRLIAPTLDREAPSMRAR